MCKKVPQKLKSLVIKLVKNFVGSFSTLKGILIKRRALKVDKTFHLNIAERQSSNVYRTSFVCEVSLLLFFVLFLGKLIFVKFSGY